MPDGENRFRRQQVAEADIEGFKEQLGPFVVAAETTRMPMVVTDAKAPGSPVIFVNQSFLALTGYGEHEVLGQNFDWLIEPGTDPEALAEIQTAFGGGRDLETEVRCRRKNGSLFWVTIFVTPVRDEAGAVVQHFASFVDLTRHKEKENRLRFVLDELNHRTHNTLATVLAIARQTLRRAADKAEVDAFLDRVLALSKGHGLLSRTNWDDVSLRDVIGQVLQPFGFGEPGAARIAAKGGDVRLQPKMVLTFAMVLHELATNAAKHGSLSTGAAGRVDISWQLEPTPQGDRMRLRWQESGGPPVTPPGRNGFGSRLIERGLARELDGEVHLDYASAGLVCQIVMPVPQDSERPSGE